MVSSEHNWANMSETISPQMLVLASRPLGCCSFQNILTNPIISQINTLLLPYFISFPYFTIPLHILQLISFTNTTPKCTLHSVFSKGNFTRENSQRRFLAKQSVCFDVVSNSYNSVPTLQLRSSVRIITCMKTVYAANATC